MAGWGWSSPGLQRLLVLLDVSLRVPSVFIIDSLLSSHWSTAADTGSTPTGRTGSTAESTTTESTTTGTTTTGSTTGSSGVSPDWDGAAGAVLVRTLGLLLALVVLFLSQKALLRFYRLFLAVVVATAAILINHHASLSSAPLGEQRPGSAPWLSSWGAPGPPSRVLLAVAALQLLLALAYVWLLEVGVLGAGLVVVGVAAPLWGPAELRRAVGGWCGAALAVHTAAVLAWRLRWCYYSCRYVYLLLRHMYRLYGLQLLLEDTWRRTHLPAVLRLFWLSRLAAQFLILLYVVRHAPPRDSDEGRGYANTAADGRGYATQPLLPPPEVLWEVLVNLLISGCDSTLTVLGMSSVISSLAHYLGLTVLLFIGSREEEDQRLGFVAPVLFFILALQTGLSSLEPHDRLVRLTRNLYLLLTAVLHFVHGMAEPVLMAVSASPAWSPRRHLPVLMVALLLLLVPPALTAFLWTHHRLSTWLFAVTAFCLELSLKVLVSLTVYGLFLLDGVSHWEGLDDIIYWVRSGGGVMEFVFGVVMLLNGGYTLALEAGSKLRALMMLLHAYFNVYLTALSGWRAFRARRAAAARVAALPEVSGEALRRLQDVCAICYQELATATAARATPCRHHYHAPCLRKWLHIQDSCPMCHAPLTPDPAHQPANNNTDPPQAPPPRDDNDSIGYDDDQWEEPQARDTPLEEEYINDQEEE